MATKKEKPVQTTAEPTLKPVRVDLERAVHKALRKAAAEAETSMAALARRIIAEHLGFEEEK